MCVRGEQTLEAPNSPTQIGLTIRVLVNLTVTNMLNLMKFYLIRLKCQVSHLESRQTQPV